MKVKLFFCLLICGINVLCFSVPYDELLSPALSARLREGTITTTWLKKPQPQLMPRHKGLETYVNAAFRELEPSLAVEVLYLYRKPVSSGNWNETQKKALFNKTLAISSLAGIQYYSASRKTMRTFYESSVVINSPERKNILPDPVFADIPETCSIYARQKDLTFGDNIYRYDYRCVNDAFYFQQENITALTAGIVTAIGKNKLRSVMAIIDCGEYLLIYGVSIAKAAAIPGIGDRIGNSFANRADAIINWFTAYADTVFM
ncbi:MAG: hypothetical protein LBB81_05615 [Treponema sp.]|jgi:hypothetical protein|nr:hypothetical protein [Treponema sp.]